MFRSIKNRIAALAIQTRFWLIRNAEPLIRVIIRLTWTPKDNLDQMIHRMSVDALEFKFLQIGANDGLINDPIYKFIIRDKWTGTRVEPLPVPFKKLTYLHGRNKRVTPMQFLIADEPGIMEIYHLSFSDSRWATGLASLDKSNLQRQIDNGYVENRAEKSHENLPKEKSDWITSSTLAVVEVNSLIQEHFANGLDLLQIDVEGFDHKLIAALDLNAVRPKMIRFEHLHIPELELAPCLDKLKLFGYQLIRSDMDYLAY